MKADDLELDELVQFTSGSLSLHGRRLVLHSSDAFGQFRQDLVKMLGPENARRVFTRFGFFWGQADAAAMKRIFQWEDITELLKAGSRMQTLEGIAETTVRKLELDESKRLVEMEVSWLDSAEALEHRTVLGPAESPACWKLVGYMSGYVSFCLNTNVFFIETGCRASGGLDCRAVGKTRENWGERIELHLPFFSAEDIVGKVALLTQELKQKSRELIRQRDRLESLRSEGSPFLAEVKSKVLLRVMEMAERVAKFDSSVLITGETGVGKEVLARFIHDASHRESGPFVAINCGALPETLLESELFGHKAGSFTGAIRDRAGLFEAAGGGTIFLDEIGDVSPAVQLKILRVLQEREVLRVGESVPIKVDVRVITATNRHLDEQVREGRFREDLLYRLRVVEIEVPPLRRRPEDILPLARHIAARLAKRLNLPQLRLDATCIDVLLAYPWPGNVRELENAIERAAVVSVDGIVRPDTLPPEIQHHAAGVPNPSLSPTRTLAALELDYIRAVLQSTGGNRQAASRILGISPSTLWRKLKE
jgi:DNA-binding NtrC family response regulator